MKKTYYSTTINTELLDWLKERRAKTGIPIAKQIEQALQDYQLKKEGV